MHKINVVYIEDNIADFDFVKALLQESDIVEQIVRVETQLELCDAIEQMKVDLVISDYALPHYNGLKALKYLVENYSEIPVILYSGAVGEEKAVELLKHGAKDYVLKDNYIRLIPAINRVLKEDRAKAEKKRLEKMLMHSKQRYEALFQNHSYPVIIFNPSTGDIIDVNHTAIEFYGYSLDLFVKLNMVDLDPSFSFELFYSKMSGIRSFQQAVVDMHHHLSSGEIRPVQLHISPICLHDIPYIYAFVTDITEQCELQNELSRTEEKYRLFVETFPGVTFKRSHNNGYDFIHGQLQSLTGYTEKEFHQNHNHFHQIIYPEDRDAVIQAEESAIHHPQNIFNKEFRIVTKDGNVKWIQRLAKYIKEPDGRFSVQGFLFDITDRMVREQESNRLQKIIEQSTLEIYTFDVDTFFFIQVNQQGINNLGYSNKEMLNLTPLQLKMGISGEEFEQLLQPLLDEQKKVVSFQSAHTRKNGSIYPVNVHVTLAQLDHKEVFISVVEDITEIQNKTSEINRLASLVYQANVAIVITDVDANIEFVNPEFERITGYERDEIMGQNPKILRSDEADPMQARQLWNSVSQGNVWRGEFINKRKDGELYIEDSVVFPIFGQEGEIINYAAIKQDITKEKEMEGQLRQSHKMEAIGQLAGGIAHDLNNILTAVNAYVEIMKDTVESESEMAEYIGNIEKSCDRAASLVNQLLVFSRKQPIQPKMLYPKSIMEDLTKMLARLVPEEIPVVYDLTKNSDVIYADKGQFEQVIVNLTLNARDAILEKEQRTFSESIHISLNERTFLSSMTLGDDRLESGDYVVLSVSDDGIGMDQRTIDKIFDPFFTTKEVGKGTGLGLSTVFGIIKQNNGAITVKSVKNKGTTFDVYWPIFEQVQDETDVAEVLQAKEHSETILVVEDDAMLRKIYCKALRKVGFHILEAENGEMAVNYIQQMSLKIDLALTDVIMPVMGGKEFANIIQSTRPEIPILFISGYTDDLLSKKGVIPDDMNFLRKPFKPSTLVKRIEELLDDEELK